MSDDQQDKNFQGIVEKINEALDDQDFSLVMNALVYMIAHGLVGSDLTKAQGIKQVSEQIADFYDYIAGEVYDYVELPEYLN